MVHSPPLVSTSYFAIPPYLQNNERPSKEASRVFFLNQNIRNSWGCLEPTSSANFLISCSSTELIIKLKPSRGKEMKPTFSVYLSHSAYFVSIELIREFVETPLSVESLSSRSTNSSEMRRVLVVVFCFFMLCSVT